MNWWLLAGSLIAVLALAGIARLLGLGGAQPLRTGEDAVALAEALVSGFVGDTGVVAANGALALAANARGELVVIEPMGARHRARRVADAQVVTSNDSPDGTVLTLALSPQEMFRITIADGETARRIAALLTGETA